MIGVLALLAVLLGLPVAAQERANGVQLRLEAYQRAVAAQLGDLTGARFERTRIVRSARGDEALCGSISTRNRRGAYSEAQPFYAEFSAAEGGRYVAHVRDAASVGPAFVAERCGGYPAPGLKPPAGPAFPPLPALP